MVILEPSARQTSLEPLKHLPQPLGPMMAVTPGSKLSLVFSAKDLNPIISRDLKYIFI
jgi:hypothetical protein